MACSSCGGNRTRTRAVTGVAGTLPPAVVGRHWVVKFDGGRYLTTEDGRKAKFTAQFDAIAALRVSGEKGEIAAEWTE